MLDEFSSSQTQV